MRLFCSICKDIFIPASEVHVTNCGHLYHASCLGIWLQRHRTCPQCRTVLTSPIKVFFDVDNEGGIDPTTLEHELENAKDKLRETEDRNKDLSERIKNFEKTVAEMKECERSLNTKNGLLKTSVSALKDRVKKLCKKTEEINSLENELQTWKTKAAGLEKLERLMKGSAQEVGIMLESTPVTPLSVKHLCTYVAVLKGQLQKLELKNVKLTKENMEFSRKADEEKMKYTFDTSEAIKKLKARNIYLENELSSLKSVLREKEKGVSNFIEEEIIIPETSRKVTMMKKFGRGSFFDFDLSDEDDTGERRNKRMNDLVENEKQINNWEELVCVGPSRMALQSKSFNRTSNESTERSDDAFAYDGFGGRKKIRLGGPTPIEEFQKIKKNKKEKRLGPTCQHRKIIDYCQRN